MAKKKKTAKPAKKLGSGKKRGRPAKAKAVAAKPAKEKSARTTSEKPVKVKEPKLAAPAKAKPVVVQVPVTVEAPAANAPIEVPPPDVNVRVSIPVQQANIIAATASAPSTKTIPESLKAVATGLKTVIKGNRHPLRRDEVEAIVKSVPRTMYTVKVSYTEKSYSISISDMEGNTTRLPEREAESYTLAG